MMRPLHNSIRRVYLATGLAVLCAIAGHAQAQAAAFPNKPLRIIVGFPPGSSTDSIARASADHLRLKLGQPVVVDNRPGANGVLAATEAARAAADGYTLLATNSSGITVNPQLYKKIAYQPERDFTALTMSVSAPFILTINPSSERTGAVHTVADWVALARAAWPIDVRLRGSGQPRPPRLRDDQQSHGHTHGARALQGRLRRASRTARARG